MLTPVFDPHFSEDSFGFRPNRSAHQAIRKVEKDMREGYRYVVDIDLEKFFDTVDHDILMSRVARRIRDKGLLRLLGKYLRAGVVAKGRLTRTVKGVPQGGPLSPLLSNILLDDLDCELERRSHRFARYADDCIILVKSKRAGHRAMRRRNALAGPAKERLKKNPPGQLFPPRFSYPPIPAPVITGKPCYGVFYIIKTSLFLTFPPIAYQILNGGVFPPYCMRHSLSHSYVIHSTQ